MVQPSVFRSATRSGLHVCARCAIKVSRRDGKRWISQRYLAKVADAELKWQERALEIKQGKKKSMLTTLEERGLIHAVTGNRDEVDRMMTDRRVGAYVGIDPTAQSLHVGHLLPLMSLFWMYVHGYHAITLVGGATAKIGDPTGRLTSRDHVHRSIRAQYMVSMHYQLKKLWLNVEAYGLKYGYKWEWAWKRGLLNNNTWMNKLPILEVLQILGPGVRMGSMLAKETVKNKMQNGDGMSFAEFTYPILQAWDWWHMYNTLGIRMQIGGADQYGNITAGIDAVKYIAENHPAPDTPKKTSDLPFGFTVPLLTTSSGAKFGKSAGNAIWLDSSLTSPFDLYGYFVSTSDTDVSRYLKLFTFMRLEDIDELVKQHMESPSHRIAQHKLASELVELIHGRTAAEAAAEQHRIVFGSSPKPPTENEGPDLAGRNALSFAQVNANNRPQAQMQLPRSLVGAVSIGRLLHAAGLAESASEGHRLAAQQAVYIGGAPTKEKMPMNEGGLSFARIKLWTPEETEKYIIGSNLLILRRGKHNIRIIELIDDEEYAKSGKLYPGKEAHDNMLKGRMQDIHAMEKKLKELGEATGTTPSSERVKIEERLESLKAAFPSPGGPGPEMMRQWAIPRGRIEEQRDITKSLEQVGRSSEGDSMAATVEDNNASQVKQPNRDSTSRVEHEDANVLEADIQDDNNTAKVLEQNKRTDAQWTEIEANLGAATVAKLKDAEVDPRNLLDNAFDKESGDDEFEGTDPEERLNLLNRRLEEELETRQRKIDEKNAPKPKFTGHFKKSRIYSGRSSWR